jgi:FlaA1/EpsC-like NDP-sugar epimerase
MLSLVGFVTVRYRGRLLSGLSWRWRAVWYHDFPVVPTRVLITGAGEAGQVTAWRLKHGSPPDVKYCVVGFVDEDPDKHGMYVEGCQVLGDYRAIPQLVEQHRVDLIVIAEQPVSGSEFRQILSYCESTDARIKVMPNIFDLLSRKMAVPFLRDIQAEDFLGRSAIGRHPSVDLGPVTHKAILVTGAAGSIGSELSRQLLTYEPIKLILLDNNESALHDLVCNLGCQAPPGSDWLVPVLADITSRVEMNRVFAQYKPQVVFHSAAYKHVPMLEYYPYKALQVNVNGTRWTAELAQYHGVERFVLISTDKAVCPANVMGATKRICELIMATLSRQGGGHTLFTSVRFGNVLGSRGSVVPTFNRQIDGGGPVTVTDKNMRRYFMTIPEAANLVIHAACLTKGGDLFMLNMGDEVRIVDLAERMIRMRGLRPYTDIGIEFTGTRPGEKLYEELHANSEIPQSTCHPDIFQLIDGTLKLEPTAFWAQLADLQNFQFWDDDRLRPRIIALAHLDQSRPDVDKIPQASSVHVPSWMVNARKSENAGTQRQVPFGG